MDVAKVDLFFKRLNHRLIIMIEKEFTCPYCWENQSRLFDPSIQNQNFIEDFEVCCNPIEFNLITNGLDVIDLSVNLIGQ